MLSTSAIAMAGSVWIRLGMDKLVLLVGTLVVEPLSI
jgi:hypothetical protein